MKNLLAIFAAALLSAAPGVASAQVSYSFSTGVMQPFIGATPGGTPVPPDLAGLLAGSSVSGSFLYDSSSPVTSTQADGSFAYGVVTSTLQTSFASLAGALSGGAIGAPLAFSDPRGFTLVGNDTLQFSALPGLPLPPRVDMFQFQTDNFGTTGTHNLEPFSIGGYTLWNVRMFWYESQATPELIPDFLASQDLLAAPPSFHGRLALDFKRTGEASGTTQFHVFYDQLTVTPTIAPIPEPETYAMLLAGLVMLGVVTWRRKAGVAG